MYAYVVVVIANKEVVGLGLDFTTAYNASVVVNKSVFQSRIKNLFSKRTRLLGTDWAFEKEIFHPY
jgi:hypothetical protein